MAIRLMGGGALVRAATGGGVVVASLAFVSCDVGGEDPADRARRVAPPSGSIVDAAHGGRAGFYWLPPLVPEPSTTGIFDPAVEPTLTVCVLDGETCAADVAVFPFGTGRGAVRLDAATESYGVVWSPPPGARANGPYYRARVDVAGQELGYLDLQIVRTGRQLRDVPDDIVGIVENRAVPFRFRVEIGATERHAASPMAPGPDRFMWQGQQVGFVDAAGDPCELTIAIATSDHATCFTAAGGSLLCAGASTTDHGPAFVDTGIRGVDQVLLSLAGDDVELRHRMCVHLESGEARCIGDNRDGQLGTGDVSDVDVLTRWGESGSLVALATGSTDAFCALGDEGDVTCAGEGFGPAPVVVGTGHAAVWMGVDSTVHFEGEDVFRVMSGHASCHVTSEGGTCWLPHGFFATVGAPGEVVEVVRTVTDIGGLWERVCWLDTAGAVSCRLYDPSGAFEESAAFAAMPVLTLAGHIGTESLCAVYVDGSVACTGDNRRGQLGVSEPEHLEDELVVAPPGSVDTTCR